MLGRLDAHYGDAAYYVHLQRDLLPTARSFLKRHDKGILYAYRSAILMGASKDLQEGADFLPLCVDYCQTVTANIETFLVNKTHQFSFHLETTEADGVNFWEWIGAEGDLEAALQEWKVKYN